jgi:hypothetical protein
MREIAEIGEELIEQRQIEPNAGFQRRHRLLRRGTGFPRQHVGHVGRRKPQQKEIQNENADQRGRFRRQWDRAGGAISCRATSLSTYRKNIHVCKMLFYEFDRRELEFIVIASGVFRSP